MKYFIRMFLFHSFALWLSSELLPTIAIEGGWQVILTAGLILTFLMLTIAPVLRILFIPINVLTLGLSSWLVNVLVVYLLTVVVPQISVRPWVVPAVSKNGFSIPSFSLSYPASLVLTSLAITLVVSISRWAAET